jgi:GGDEF domain-containing protein
MISAPIRIGEANVSITASAGVALGLVDEVSALRISADEASYRSKRRGGSIVSMCGERSVR